MYYEEYEGNDIVDFAVDILEHYGTKRHSGRFPWSSGGDPYQHEEWYPFRTSGDFLNRVEEMTKAGKTSKEIAEELDLTDKQLKVFTSVAKANRRAEEAMACKQLYDEGMGYTDIARKLGFPNESKVRNLLSCTQTAKRKAAEATVQLLEDKIKEKGFISVGPGDEINLGISYSMLDAALVELEGKGYEVFQRRSVNPTNPDVYTTIRVACPPGTEWKEIYNNSAINFIDDYASHDGGATFDKMKYPTSIDSKRLEINYADTGTGATKDGLIEIRPGVKDLSLGDSHYAQVRILVDGDRYLKGMAVYSDDLPEGIDIRFNTSKPSSKGLRDTLKEIGDDPTNPFGSYIPASGQSYYEDENGERKLSAINKRQDEGDWATWSKTLPSQMLGKQKKELIEKQLNLTLSDKKAEFEEIMSITNPTVKSILLGEFAGDCDSNAVDLSAAPLPRQKYNVILPLSTIGDNEIYAPNYKDGETVALIRFPHDGTFQIPVLKVNNKNKEGIEMITPGAADAVGISAAAANQLSGADFDGDTVLVIPTTKGRNGISAKAPLEALKDFDTKLAYPPIYDPSGAVDEKGKPLIISKVMSEDLKQKKMGEASNLIMDMTLKGASDDELARAVKYSMTVIDSPKHKLNYEACYKEQNIKELEAKWKTTIDEFGNESHGASTLLTKSTAEYRVPKRKGGARIADEKYAKEHNVPVGSIYYNTAPDSERFYTDKNGKVIERMTVSTRMAETHNPYELSSGTVKENMYAKFSLELKTMANNARVEQMNTGILKYDKEAAKKYAPEVESLKEKLKKSQANIPRERAAGIKAEGEVKERLAAIKESNLGISKKELRKEQKKIAQSAIENWRAKYNAKRIPIDITDREWEAIQAGAIHDTTFKQIYKYADKGKIRERATPKHSKELTQGQQNRIKALAASGYTNEMIADIMNCSTATVTKYKKA